MTPAQIIALINTQIISNGVGAITGPILNNILTLIVSLFTSTAPACRIVSSSTLLNVLVSDFRIGYLRTLGLAAMQTQLPTTGISIGQEFVLQDLAGNFSTYPNTVLPPPGMTFSGNRATYVMNEDNQTARFAFFGSNVWGVEPA